VSTNPTKREIIDEIQHYLVTELKELGEAPSERAAEIHRQLLMFRFLPVREFGPEDVICPGGLVELELNGMRALYFVVPTGGGLVMQIAGRPIQVITPQSPLGEAILGRKVGDIAKVTVGSGVREYRIVGFF
jgi:hypothetical protein